MSVNIKFEPEGRSGIIAEGTYLWDAAKRLGIYLPAECEGRGECDTCAVIVKEGATLLSSLTESERERLSPERLAAGERLACQTKVEHAGDVVLQPVPVTEREETAEEALKGFRKEFREMPLDKKLATLVELEAVAMMQTFSTVFNLPFTVGEKVLGFMAGRGRAMTEREREARRPAEHRTATQAASSVEESEPKQESQT
ncbi:MAG TPA: 2Fe-2S iron-sulfur cluster-binding protein [Pyrinomonadaceae bacterium]|nr:2Fe-2S iron-sulfur cluster-binding protein [Pyrinomonadaceae bacterium]